jgi:hypothetical protein
MTPNLGSAGQPGQGVGGSFSAVKSIASHLTSSFRFSFLEQKYHAGAQHTLVVEYRLEKLVLPWRPIDRPCLPAARARSAVCHDHTPGRRVSARERNSTG